MKRSEVLWLAEACPESWSTAQVVDYCFTRLVAGEIKTTEQALAHWRIRQWVGEFASGLGNSPVGWEN